MRITKSMIRDIRRQLVESQAKVCAIATGGKEALDKEFKERHPFFVGEPPANPMETVRQLLYDDMAKIITPAICD